MPPSKGKLQTDIMKALMKQSTIFNSPAIIQQLAADLAKAIDRYVNSI